MYKKIVEGGTFGPGASLKDDRSLYKNCTFLADCTFGDHCDFDSCTFKRCCPKPYTNVSTIGEHARFFNCTLESVNVGPAAELYNTNKSGYLVTLQSVMPNDNKVNTAGPTDPISSTSPIACGQRFNSVDFRVGQQFQPCGITHIEGFTNPRIHISTK